MQNFLFQQSHRLVQVLESIGFLPENLRVDASIAPCPDGKEQDWCMPFHGLEIDSSRLKENRGGLEEIISDWEWESGYLNFNWKLKEYQLSEAGTAQLLSAHAVVNPKREVGRRGEMGSYPHEIQIELCENLRHPDVHAQLAGQRTILTRFRKFKADIVKMLEEAESRIRVEKLSVSNPSELQPEERDLINAGWWLLFQLESREKPWTAKGITQCIAPFTQAMTRCWENVRLDAGGDILSSYQRLRRWRQDISTVEAILRGILP